MNKPIDDLSRGDPDSLTLDDLANKSMDSDADGDSELEDSLVRSNTMSTVSMMDQDRLDALSRANAELSRRIQESERALLQKVTDHEIELEELQAKLDELTEELHATKREEKELRTKEV